MLPAIFSHRIPAHLDPVSIVNHPAEDAVGHCRITDMFVPGGSPATAT